MAIGPRDVMRSDVDGGLSGPANPIPSESLDCGCQQFPCPKLAKFATRGFFVGLLCWIGIIQGAAQSYLYITSPTIARKFQFDPTLMEWILIIGELTPFLLGFLVAYWGDRIHRAAWTGALVLVQSVGFLVLIIPHFTHRTRIIEESENATHMSIYAEDNPEMCSPGLARLIIEEDQVCYITLALLVIVQILTGMANVAYYALGISYLDDNTKKRHIGALIGFAIAVKLIGLLLGFVIAWGCLKLDSEDLTVVETYREQLGAWWLGWPILAVLLAIPAVFMTWLPRRLPSEVVEQAAASILDLAGRTSPSSLDATEARKVGGTGFFTSLGRLFTNKVLVCSVFAAIFGLTALVNFAANENIILESRYHVPRPTGMLLGFGDPLWSRIITSIFKPIIIGMVIVISGLVIVRARPRATSLVIYNVVVFVLAATMIFSLVYATCDKPWIPGEQKRAFTLLQYCNMDCGCSKDADFRPLCDVKSTVTFYSPCHAGCKTMETVNNVNIYKHCNCIKKETGFDNTEGREGPCGSKACQIGWLVFEIGTLLAYSLVASSVVGSLLIVLRSVYVQDKALAIGFWMTFVALFAYVPGKLAYMKIDYATCKHWGKGSVCHFHDDRLGDYMCYLTAFLLILNATFEIVLWYFCRKLPLYEDSIKELPRGTELTQVQRNQVVPLLDGEPTPSTSNAGQNASSHNEQVGVIYSSVLDLRECEIEEESQQRSVPLKYGPLGPGDRRTDPKMGSGHDLVAKMRNEDSDDELDSSSDEDGSRGARTKTKMLGSSPHVAYKPLELDSDVESDLSSIGPRSRKRIASTVSDDLRRNSDALLYSTVNKRPFPNPDDYENPPRSSPSGNEQNQRNPKGQEEREITTAQGGFSRTNSFEFSKNKAARNESLKNHEGDFNEVGIPVMAPLVTASILTSSKHPGRETNHHEVQVLLPRHQKQASQERLETIRSLLESVDETRRHHLGNETLREEENEDYPDVPPPIIGSPPPRDQAKSGFGLGRSGERFETFISLPGTTDEENKAQSTNIQSSKHGPIRKSPLSTAL